MIPTYYDHERLAHAHHQKLLCEAEHERLLAGLSKQRNRERDALQGREFFWSSSSSWLLQYCSPNSRHYVSKSAGSLIRMRISCGIWSLSCNSLQIIQGGRI